MNKYDLKFLSSQELATLYEGPEKSILCFTLDLEDPGCDVPKTVFDLWTEYGIKSLYCVDLFEFHDLAPQYKRKVEYSDLLIVGNNKIHSQTKIDNIPEVRSMFTRVKLCQNLKLMNIRIRRKELEENTEMSDNQSETHGSKTRSGITPISNGDENNQFKGRRKRKRLGDQLNYLSSEQVHTVNRDIICQPAITKCRLDVGEYQKHRFTSVHGSARASFVPVQPPSQKPFTLQTTPQYSPYNQFSSSTGLSSFSQQHTQISLLPSSKQQSLILSRISPTKQIVLSLPSSYKPFNYPQSKNSSGTNEQATSILSSCNPQTYHNQPQTQYSSKSGQSSQIRLLPHKQQTKTVSATFTPLSQNTGAYTQQRQKLSAYQPATPLHQHQSTPHSHSLVSPILFTQSAEKINQKSNKAKSNTNDQNAQSTSQTITPTSICSSDQAIPRRSSKHTSHSQPSSLMKSGGKGNSAQKKIRPHPHCIAQQGLQTQAQLQQQRLQQLRTLAIHNTSRRRRRRVSPRCESNANQTGTHRHSSPHH